MTARVDYYFAVRRVLIVVFFLDLAVSLAKGIYGFKIGSLSMLSDGIHSLFDSSSDIIGLIGIGLASRPPDKEHPYGHAKFETFASVGIAILLFATCIEILQVAISRFFSPSTPEITAISFVITGATMAINILVSFYEYTLGKRLKSSILVADSMHTRSNIYASVGVILGFVAVIAGYPLADPIIALIIVGLIFLTGVEILKESSEVLLDRALVEESIVRLAADSVQGVCTSHRVRTRGSPGEIYVDLHIGVDPTLSVEEGHRISLEVEAKIKRSINGVKDVAVHVDPRERCEVNVDPGELEGDDRV
jgi:cation diffusion facilitator family transporter